MDSLSRCSHLKTLPSPGNRLDYVVHLEGQIPCRGGAVSVSLRYIPDKLILNPEGFGKYLSFLSSGEPVLLEQLAVMVMEDINNETVARWIQVFVSGPENAYPEIGRHGVLAEDRQPKWDNSALLARLKRI